MIASSVIIVGGGFSGSAAAAALADGRRKITVLEARTGPDPRFRGELIHPHGVAVLAELGLLSGIQRAGGVSVEGFATVLDRDRPPVLLKYDDIDGGSGNGLSVAHQDMVDSMRREVERRPGVSLRTGQRVTELLREDGRIAGVRTAAGEELRADLTVVAEGRHSRLRGMLGFPEETKLLSFTAALLARGAELPSPGYGHVFLGTHGPILAYAIGGGRVRMCIDLPIGSGKGHEAVAAFIEQECAPSVPDPLRGAMLRALREDPPEICANHAIRTHRCTAPGVALVGDSGGCSHPLTATGMTIGLNDLRVLSDELAGGGTVDEALRRYERRRYAFVRAREIVAQGLYDVFRGEDAGARALRSGVFRYWRGGPRARAASLALLSGRESRLHAFLAEFVRVVGHSTRSAIETNGPSIGAIGALYRTAYDQLDRTLRMVYADVARGRSEAAGSPSRRVTFDPASADAKAQVTAPRTSGLL